MARLKATLVWLVCLVVIGGYAVVFFVSRGAVGRPGNIEHEAGAQSPQRPATSASERGPQEGAPPAASASEREPQDSAPPAEGPRFSAGDTTYTEPGSPCDGLADIADLVAAHRPDASRATLEGLAKRRYPTGLPFLQAQDDKTLAVWLRGTPPTFEGAASRFDAAVHEGSHLWGVRRFDLAKVLYPVRTDLTIETARLTNFPRSEILTLHVDGANDSYATTYLGGASGAQGFNALLDEFNAYTHTLAARVCTRDLVDPHTRVSGRDGILAMMYYVELYLRIAREKHPVDYAAIMKDPGHRRLIRVVWNRAELWLRRSAAFPALGVHDARIERWAYAADGLAEIARVRAADR